MAEKWFACSSQETMPVLLKALEILYPVAVVRKTNSPDEARAIMLAQQPYHASLAVGPDCTGVSSINLAAAVVADGHADEVILVEHNPSGSLRSRALRAGITRVMNYEDINELVARGTGGSHIYSKQTEPERSLEAPVPRTTTRSEVTDLEEPSRDVYVDSSRTDQSDKTPASRLSHDAILAVPSIPPGRKEHSAPVLVFASGRGGVGKTSLAAMSAVCAASWGLHVAALDLDLSAGDLAHVLGVGHPSDLSALSRSSVPTAEQLKTVSVQIDEHLCVLGPCDRPEMAERISPIVSSLITVLANEFELVVVDTSTTWTDAVAQAAQSCDRLLLVSDDIRLSPASLSRMASLAVRLGVARTRIMRISNRCDSRSQANALLHRADIGLETARELRVLEGGDEVGELAASGHLADLVSYEQDFPDSLSTALAKILEELGRLPDCSEAQTALHASVPRKARSWFVRMREAV